MRALITPFCLDHPSYLHSKSPNSRPRTWQPLSPEVLSFSVWKARWTGKVRKRAIMRYEKVRSDPNYPNLQFLGPAPGDDALKARAIRQSQELAIWTTGPLIREPAVMTRRTALPARYPPISAWPVLMRADMAAAYLDYRDTRELARAVRRGEAPPPIGYHGVGRTREPVWSRAIIDRGTAAGKTMALDRMEGQDLASLV